MPHETEVPNAPEEVLADMAKKLCMGMYEAPINAGDSINVIVCALANYAAMTHKDINTPEDQERYVKTCVEQFTKTIIAVGEQFDPTLRN